MDFLLPYISYQAQWQTDVLLFLQSLRNDPLNVIFYGISAAGNETFYIIFICVLFWCINKHVGYIAGFSLVSANILNAGLKNTCKIPRPVGHNGIECVQKPFDATPYGYSFPSGHSMGAGSFWTALLYGFRQRWITILCILMMILIPVSRLYLGVHTPIDVLTGLTFGILVSLLMGKFLHFSTGKKKYLMLLPALVFAVWAAFMPEMHYWKMFGALVGITAGYYIETEAIKLRMPKKASAFIFRMILGLIVLIALKEGLKLVLPESLLSGAFRYCCIGLWVTAGAPFVFTKLKI